MVISSDDADGDGDGSDWKSGDDPGGDTAPVVADDEAPRRTLPRRNSRTPKPKYTFDLSSGDDHDPGSDDGRSSVPHHGSDSVSSDAVGTRGKKRGGRVVAASSSDGEWA